MRDYGLPVVESLVVDGGGSLNKLKSTGKHAPYQIRRSDVYPFGDIPMLISAYCWLLVLVLPAVATDVIVRVHSGGNLQLFCAQENAVPFLVCRSFAMICFWNSQLHAVSWLLFYHLTCV